MSDEPAVSRLRRRPPEAIPLTLLTGFLGAGKTTLLNALVRAPEMARSVVVINEFGDVAIDHLLVEQADGDLLTLSSGCVCCSVRGDLVEMLEDLLRRRDNGRMTPFDRVVIETTGLADPGPIVNAIAAHPYLVLRYRLDAIVTVVDALHGLTTLDAHHEAVDQVAMADVLVLTKTDLADDAAGPGDRLQILNPSAPRLDAARGEASAAALIAAGLARGDRPRASVPGHGHDHSHHDHDHDHDHGHAHSHDDGLGSLVLSANRPLETASVPMFLDLLRAGQGTRLLRAKGLLAVDDDPARPLVVQMVQGILHPARRLPAWPDADTSSRFVVIGRNLDMATIRGLWDAFFAGPGVDRPDAAALSRRLDDGGPGLF